MRQTEEDIGVGASHPKFGPPSYSKQKQNGRDIGKSISVPDGARIAVNGAFKPPTLRNIEMTGPYFHNGGSEDGVALDNDFVLPATGRDGGEPFSSFEEILHNGY